MVLRKTNFYLSPKFKILLDFISALSIAILFQLTQNQAVLSQNLKLGVIKTEENTAQWEQINARLRSMNIDYCTIDFAFLPENLALNHLNTLFIPNGKTWNYLQVKTLEDWLNRGQIVIVSGETGSKSPPDLKNKLRSLLGAYWGFSLINDTNLNPVTVEQENWFNLTVPMEAIEGGVIIPFGVGRHTAAVWNTSGNLPAVVMGDQAVFMGWQWGEDQVASSSFDQTWLRAILNHYGAINTAQSTTGRPCRSYSNQGETPNNSQNSQVIEPSNDQQIPSNFLDHQSQTLVNEHQARIESQPLGENRVNTEDNPEELNFTPPPENFDWERELLTKEQDLRSLINRIESAFFTAQAYATSPRELTLEDKTINLISNSENNRSFNSLIEQAKQELNIILDLISQKKYEEAEIKILKIQDQLLENYPSDRSLAQPEIRYLWLDRGTIVKAKSEADLIPLFDQFAKAGINIIFMETLNAGYTIYPSQIAPEQNPLLKGWDPLKSAVKLAHERGMELHAWVWVFATANQRHNQILNQSADYLGPVLSRHLDWIMTDNQGNLFQPSSQKAFLDPSNPDVRAYLLSIFEEIVTNYDVDGLQLDYIRYPFQNPYFNDHYGYSLSAREQFFKITGVDPINLKIGDNLWQKWTEFKVKQIDTFVATVSEKLKAKKPNLIISAAVFPIEYNQRIEKIQQNWENWIKENYIDLLLPMTYGDNTKEFESLTEPIFQSKLTGSTLILPGIRIQNQSQISVLDQVQYARSLPTLGYGFFAADNFNSNLYQILLRTQGDENLTEIDLIFPHRQPFMAALQRYQRLQQEWNFWLDQGQLNLDEATIKQWKESQTNLINQLQVLVNQPNEMNYLLTQLQLRIFQSYFKTLMTEYGKINNYQVEVWNNRLLALEQLLNYGEKRNISVDN